MSVKVEIKGVQALQHKFGKSIQPYIRAGSMAIGKQLEGILSKAPGPAHHPVIWTSQKQKRFYFAMRRRKGFPLEYSRNNDPQSQRLEASWTVATRGAMGAVVGTRVNYARYVQREQNPGGQQPMHVVTGWITDKQAAEQLIKSGAIPRIMRQALRKALE